MTTSVHTKCGDIFLADCIGNYFYETFKDAPDSDGCMDELTDFVIGYVNDRLHDNLTWFPYISEVYVEFDPDADDDDDDDFDADDIDNRELDDTLCDLIGEAMAKAETMLDEDPNAFGPSKATPETVADMVSDWLTENSAEMEGLFLDGSPYYCGYYSAWVQDAHDDRYNYLLIANDESIEIEYNGTR